MQEEILEITHWVRQAGAVIIGVVYGFGKVTGLPGISSFLAMCTAGIASLITHFHRVDEDEVAKIGSLNTEGVMPAFALFILTWIISYSTFL